jgi:hypothetical protein
MCAARTANQAWSKMGLPQRLLTRAEAAAYCRLSPGVFERECPVIPLIFGSGDRRLYRWDRADLDAWIECYKGGATQSGEPNWLARAGDDNRAG